MVPTKNSHIGIKNFLQQFKVILNPLDFLNTTSPHWQAAMKNEIDALERNQTWSRTTLPHGKTTLVCKCDVKLKGNLMEVLSVINLDLLFRGNTQVQGLDYHENFASVVYYLSLLLRNGKFIKWT